VESSASILNKNVVKCLVFGGLMDSSCPLGVFIPRRLTQKDLGAVGSFTDGFFTRRSLQLHVDQMYVLVEFTSELTLFRVQDDVLPREVVSVLSQRRREELIRQREQNERRQRNQIVFQLGDVMVGRIWFL
jgi:hypothetical protein